MGFIIKTIIIPIALCIISDNAKSQNVFSKFKDYTVSIGYVDSVLISYQPIKKEKRFILIGSGLLTYNKYDTSIINCIITAKHVIKFFEEKKLNSFFIRFSWADSILTSSYFGLEVPLKLENFPLYFYHENPRIDLGCILLTGFNDPVFDQYYASNRLHILAHSDINDSELGDNVLIYGYPGHIEDYTSTLSYIVCTFKPGIVTWKSEYKTNTFLDDILLIESNASYGNSGGPVFYVNTTGFDGSGKGRITPYLVGILIGGTSERNAVKLNDEIFIDASKNMFYTENRSGVSTVIKAKIIKDLLSQVNNKLTKILSPKHN